MSFSLRKVLVLTFFIIVGTIFNANYAANPPTLTDQSFIGEETIFFSQTPINSGDLASSWALISGTLPTGLSLNSATGEISGTPTTNGSFSVSIEATNNAGSSLANFDFTITPALRNPICFSEDFSAISSGDNITIVGSNSPWDGNGTWTVTKAFRAGGVLRLGTSTEKGAIDTVFTPTTQDVLIKFDVKGWTTKEGDISVTLGAQTHTYTFSAVMTDPFQSVKHIFLNVPIGTPLLLRFETTTKRAFIDNIEVICVKESPYYRSVNTGNWTNSTTWEVADNISGPWYPSLTYPISANSSKVFIEDNTHVTLDISNAIDYLEVKENGTLETLPTSKLTIYDSISGADFIVNGTYINRSNSTNSIEFGTGATWQLGNNGKIIKTNAGATTGLRDRYQGGIASIPATAQWIYRYNGDGNPSLATANMYYPHLRFENTTATAYTAISSSSFTGSSPMVIKGNLEIGTTGTSTFKLFNNHADVNLTLVKGDLKIGAGSELTNEAATGTNTGTGYQLEGDLIVDGTFNLTAGTTERNLKLIGVSNQAISGNGTINVHKVEVNKPSGEVLLVRDLQVQNELKMVKGNILTGTNTLELGLNSTQKGILDYTDGFVLGKMKRWFGGTNSGISTSLFPLGFNESGIKNRFVNINFTTAPIVGGELTAEFINSDMTFNGLPIESGNSGGFNKEVTNAENQGYWAISTTSLNGGIYTVSLTGEGFSEVADVADLTLLKRSNNTQPWTTPGSHIATTGTLVSPIVSRSGLTGFSDFGFGSSNTINPLPIELLSFTADCNVANVSLYWETGTENNNAYFLIEKSLDGSSWGELVNIKGNGNTTTKSNYSFIDRESRNTVQYYRLSQVDFNGQRTTFDPISVSCTHSNMLQVYPNPSANLTHITAPISINSLVIYSLEGKLIETITVNDSHYLLDVSTYEEGVYLLLIIDQEGIEYFQKLSKKN